MKELSWPVEETGLVAAERDREGVGVQRVGTGMDRAMEPAREKDFVTAAVTAPKKAAEREPGTVTAQAGGKVAATEQIRKI